MEGAKETLAAMERKKYMRSGAVARILGVPKRTLVYRLKNGQLPEPLQSEGGHYLWTQQDIELIRTITSGRSEVPAR